MGVGSSAWFGHDLRPALAHRASCLCPYGNMVPDTFSLLYRPPPQQLLRGGHHDFDEHVRTPEVSLHARAYRRILRINPRVPDGVVRLEQPHV